MQEKYREFRAAFFENQPQENGVGAENNTWYGGWNKKIGVENGFFFGKKRRKNSGIWYRNLQRDTPGSVVIGIAGKGR